MPRDASSFVDQADGARVQLGANSEVQELPADQSAAIVLELEMVPHRGRYMTFSFTKIREPSTQAKSGPRAALEAHP